MRNLLNANFRKLIRDKFLWIACVVCFAMCVINSFDSAKGMKRMAELGKVRSVEFFLYNGVSMLGLLSGEFISLFLGTEHADGTLRNKLTVGRTRSSVYLASFLTCFIGSLILLAFWFAGSVMLLPLSGRSLDHGWGNVCFMLVLLIGMQAVFSGIYALIGNLCTNKAMTVVYSLLVFGGIFIVSTGLYDRLGEPEFHEGMAMINGQFVDMSGIPNPLYLSSTIREVCQALLEMLPIGQGILIAYLDVIHPIRQLVFSIIWTIALVGIGMAFFQKKDLK